MSAQELAHALGALAALAEKAGIDPRGAREEGARLAAAVAESSPGAPRDWLDQVEPDGELADFFTAASAGRRWRTAPTDLLDQLVRAGQPQAPAYAAALRQVVVAAARLGQPGPHVAERAARTALVQGVLTPAPAQRSPVPGEVTGVAPDPLRLPTPSIPASSLPPELPSLGAILAALGRPVDEPGVSPTGGAAGPRLTPSGATPSGTTVTQEAAEPQAEPAPQARPVAELLAELEDLIGLERVKSEVRRQVELLRIETLRVEAGLTQPTITRHLVFVGNPGTGKTTVARLVAGIYHSLGLLAKGHLVEVDRSELVAGYLGQTAIKTAEVVASALGGVLFIDEAYALTQGTIGPDSYGAEAVNTLVKEMEDHRDDLVVIVAGYPRPMAEFVATNPGLASRFSTTISFEDYTDAELGEIFASMAKAADFTPTPQCQQRVEEIVAAALRDEGFGNARFVRNLLDAAVTRHAWRLRDVAAPTLEELRTLHPEDLADDGDPGPVVPGPGVDIGAAMSQEPGSLDVEEGGTP